MSVGGEDVVSVAVRPLFFRLGACSRDVLFVATPP